MFSLGRNVSIPSSIRTSMADVSVVARPEGPEAIVRFCIRWTGINALTAAAAAGARKDMAADRVLAVAAARRAEVRGSDRDMVSEVCRATAIELCLQGSLAGLEKFNFSESWLR